MQKNANHEYSASFASILHRHPYGSDVEWRIAVSRRFNDPTVNTIYEEQIHPVIASHGIVLECSFASDETEDIEFWTNRMRIMLACADIHILIDIHKSVNVDFEVRLSNSCANIWGKNFIMLNSGFFDVGRLPPRSFLPIQVRVTDGEGKTKFNRSRRNAIVHALPHDLLSDRLHEALQWAIKKRTWELREVRFLYDRPTMWINKVIRGLDMPTVMEVQVQMTTVATKLAVGNRLIEAHDELFSDLKGDLSQMAELFGMPQLADSGAPDVDEEEHADPMTRMANRMDQFEIDILNGSIRLPKGLKEAYIFIRDERARILMETISLGKWSHVMLCIGTAFCTLRLKRALCQRAVI